MPEVRADRIATLYFFHPLQRFLHRPQAGIPILMYHSISTSAEVHRNAYFHTCTSPQVFREHLDFLALNGYSAIRLGEAVRKLKEGARTNEKPVVLTFDDGFEDFYTEAFPILSAFGYTAIVFLPTAYIGDTARKFNGTPCLTWSQVRELRKAGIEFGSHTVTHPQLHGVGPEQLREEMTASKEQIEENLGEPVETFSYPYAFPSTDRKFVGRLRESLQEIGYRDGVSTTIGRVGESDDRFFMKRLPVNSHDELRLFRAKLEGGYDWLRTVQCVSKLRLLGRDAPRAMPQSI